MTALPRPNDYEEALRVGVRTIAGAEPELQLSVLRNVAGEMARYIAGGHLGKCEVADRLLDQARSVGLIARYGIDVVQKALADGFVQTGAFTRAASLASIAIIPRVTPSFHLVPFRELKPSLAGAYLIKDLIPRVGLTVIWGPPKSGKSFVIWDALMHVAL